MRRAIRFASVPWRAISLGPIISALACDGGAASAGAGAAITAVSSLLWSLDVAGEPHALEVDDGRLAVTIPGEHRVLLLDSTGAAIDSFGRAGRGPGEFAAAGAIFATDGGGWAVLDFGTGRANLYDQRWAFRGVEMLPPSHDVVSARRLPDGSWLSLISRPGESDTADIIRTGPRSEEPSKILGVHIPATVFVAAGNIGFNLAPEYAARDVWGAVPDGRVWVARGSTNRVDWVGSDGSMRVGSPVPFRRIRTVDRDRHMLGGLRAPDNLRDTPRPLASVKAPFQDVVAGGDGELWFWLNQPHGFGTELHQCRTLSGQATTIAMPLGSKIIHVGANRLYVYQVDEGGEARLRAYVKPPCEA